MTDLLHITADLRTTKVDLRIYETTDLLYITADLRTTKADLRIL